jgi:hypothetical protein
MNGPKCDDACAMLYEHFIEHIRAAGVVSWTVDEHIFKAVKMIIAAAYESGRLDGGHKVQ